MSESPQKGRKAQPPPARGGGFGVVLWVALVIIVAAGGAAGAWYAYERGLEAGIAASPPLITAEAGPSKVAPEDEGGIEVPNQDALVFDAIVERAEEPAEEVLAPGPEEPMAKPAPEPPGEAELAAVDTTAPATEEAAAEGAGVAEEGGEMAEVEPAPGGPEETTAVEEDVLVPPEPDVVEDAMAVASAPAPEVTEAPSPEPLRIEPESRPETIVLQEPPATEPETETEMAAVTESVEPAPAAAEMGLGPRVQLAAFRSPERAEVGWGRILEAHRDLLDALDHWVVRVDLGAEKGIFHRLQAGPLTDAETAKALCETLKAREQGCLVVAP